MHPQSTSIDEALLARFWAKVDQNGPAPAYCPDLGPCWLWLASLNRDGYGQFWFNHRMDSAHRYAYLTFVGPIPAGLTLDHLCRVRRCANPRHLEPVTKGINALRGEGWAGRNARKTHCPQGHPYAGDNLYVLRTARFCRQCNRAAAAALKRRKREALL